MCRLWLKLGVAILFLTAANAATAQVGPWPNQNVRIIAPFAAGGTAVCWAGFLPTICRRYLESRSSWKTAPAPEE